LFRGYKIKQGKKIKLDNIFIQRKGKRLVSSGERAELSSYRFNKTKNKSSKRKKNLFDF